MELKPLMSGHSFLKAALILTVIVLVAVCLVSVFSGCTKEEVPVEATMQLVIPSELEPGAILPFDGKDYYECVYDVNDKTKICGDVQRFIEGDALEKDFVKGYVRRYSIYILKSGEQLGVSHSLLRIIVLKYETSEVAEEAFNVFAEADDLIVDGVKIKGVEGRDHPKEAAYVLQSNNFIIRVDGHIEAARDAMGRIIELYSVPKGNSY